ncbi:ATP-binding protein [Vibrio vulnificus]|uniref:ATP-binding protein n=1 Tax=Vibrio vulnificus TaxID=672 RepID=UPI00405842C5
MRVQPIIHTAHALTSMRESGFSFSSAIGELVDNSIEAGASHIECNFYGDHRSIDSIAVSDNGCGMDPDTLFDYPVIGKSTRYGSTSGIGRFGVGANYSALTFATKICAYSRTSISDPFKYVEFDLIEAMALENKGDTASIGVKEPVISEIPPQFMDIVKDDTKTVIIWTNIDKLDAGKRSQSIGYLNEELQSELQRAFRNFIYHGITLVVNGTALKHFDPLMQLRGSIQDEILTKTYDSESDKVNHYPSILIADKVKICTVGGESAYLSIAVYPKEVVRRPSMGGDNLAKMLRVPENQGKISFVRMGREISYAAVPQIFSRAVVAEDRFIAITVEFNAKLDEFFGVRSVKRGVEPFDVVRTEIREHLKHLLPTANRTLRQLWSAEDADAIDFDAIENAVAQANLLMKKCASEIQGQSMELNVKQRNALIDLARQLHIDDVDSYADKKRGKPFIIDAAEFEDNDMFIDVKFLESQVHILINQNHIMYQKLWEPLNQISKQSKASIEFLDPIQTAQHALNTLNIMLICLAKSQMHQNFYKFDELIGEWGSQLSQFLMVSHVE